MRKLFSSIISIAVLLSLVVFSTNVEAANQTFSDVPTDLEAFDEINYFVEKNYIQGFEDGTFRPDDNLTREQAAVIFTRILELDLADNEEVTKHFDDVKANSANAAHIAAVNKVGIMSGSNGKFRPYDKLTREQMATIMVRGLSLQATDQEVDIYLGNVDPSHRGNVQIIANHGITNQLADFNPSANVTRAQFILMVSRALDYGKDDEQSISELLKEVYANEMQLESYEMGANINFGIILPEIVQDLPEGAMIAQMLEDIQIDFTGVYQKDPMLMEANVDVTMNIDPQMSTTFSIPIIMNEDKLWMKFPQIPGEEMPEEFEDKFIEIDFNELNELTGQPTPNMDVQLEFAEAVQNLFIDYFADDYYNYVDLGSYDVPEGVNAKQVVKFNLDNEDLEPFIKTLMTGFLPEIFELMQKPEYAEAIGLTEEEVKVAQEEFQSITENIDEIVLMLNEVLNINAFEEYIVINDQNIIVNDILNLDVDITVEDETVGIVLSTDMSKWNINNDVTVNIPNKDEIISFEDLFDDIEEDLPLY